MGEGGGGGGGEIEREREGERATLDFSPSFLICSFFRVFVYSSIVYLFIKYFYFCF